VANPGFQKNYNAVAAIPAYHIVKPSGVNDGEVIPAAASTDPIIGVSQNVDVAAGQFVDVIHTDSANAMLGGQVAFGDPLTSDENGCAVKAAPAAGTNAQVVGKAMCSGVAGDIIPVLVVLSVMQG
jgi:hypothetical protein